MTTVTTATAVATRAAQPLDPRVRTLWHVLWALGLTPVLVAAVVAVVVGLIEDLPALVAVGAASVTVAVVVVVAVPRVRYARWRWQLTAEGLEVAHGVVRRVESSIPVFRVQQIDLRQGPLERIFGLVTLQITTASAASDGTLPGIDSDRAEAVRRELLGRVAADDGV